MVNLDYAFKKPVNPMVTINPVKPNPLEGCQYVLVFGIALGLIFSYGVGLWSF